MRGVVNRTSICKIIGYIFFVVSTFFGGSTHANTGIEKIPEANYNQSHIVRYGLDLLLGFLPTPMIEADIQFDKLHFRTTFGSSLLWGRISGGLAYSIADRKGAELYIDVGGFYAGFVYGHFYEAGIEIKKFPILNSDLRLGVALLNTDSRDPWNGSDVETTRVFPRIGFVRSF